jgi:hypothetical protein
MLEWVEDDLLIGWISEQFLLGLMSKVNLRRMELISRIFSVSSVPSVDSHSPSSQFREGLSMDEKKRWLVVVIFAMAMAWVESAVVLYLRTMINRLVPYQPDPLPIMTGLGEAELVREAATLVMLVTVGWLAGRTWRSRLAYTVLAFGVWDIFYYVFLLPLTHWPSSLFDWDVLFLIPLPWWGPVIAPVAISIVLIVFGTFVSQFDQPEQPVWPGRLALAFFCLGATLALYTFMADTLRVAGEGVQAIRNVLPIWFNWPLFSIGLAMMTAPVPDVVKQLWGTRLNPVGLQLPSFVSLGGPSSDFEQEANE